MIDLFSYRKLHFELQFFRAVHKIFQQKLSLQNYYNKGDKTKFIPCSVEQILILTISQETSLLVIYYKYTGLSYQLHLNYPNFKLSQSISDKGKHLLW